MYKVYLKQAVALLRQNPFISTVSVVGTALAIMMVMTLIVTQEIRTTTAAPEINSDRILTMRVQYLSDTARNSMSGGNISMENGRLLKGLATPELISIQGVGTLEQPVNLPGETSARNYTIRLTDGNYWEMFRFKWLAGRPYGEEEVDAGVADAVIDSRVSRELFGEADPIGKTIVVSFREYRVTGVVDVVSPVFPNAYSRIWLPYTTQDIIGMQLLLLARDKGDFPAIDREVREVEYNFNIANAPQTIWFKGPESRKYISLGIWANDADGYIRAKKRTSAIRGAVIAFLLLIPAVNLAGFSLARSRKRTTEIGIRKAFGARRGVIMVQVLFENFITSLIGGFLGLGLSYAVILSSRAWLLDIPAGSEIPFRSLFSVPVFLAVLLFSLILNLLSAGIPAYRSSMMSIVNCLNRNDNKK